MIVMLIVKRILANSQDLNCETQINVKLTAGNVFGYVHSRLPRWCNLFSMGSVIKSHSFPTKQRNAFVNVFAKLKQRVLWRRNNDTLPNKPENVIIQNWMPQYDILCHPNVVAFINHGGLLRITEAIHCGVPMIILPQWGDHFINAKVVETIGAGVFLYFSDITETNIFTALNTVLRSSFTRQVEAVSMRFRDRPMSPMDIAVYWVEYVGRHRGATQAKLLICSCINYYS